jgi:hypothetical protein
MFRNSVAVVMVLGIVGSASSAAWPDQLFQEVSKDFGSVPRGPALQHVFAFKNTTPDDIHITSIRVSCGCVTATAPQSLIHPGEEGSIVAHMDTTRFIGVKSVTIYVQFDQPSYQEVRLWVRANGRDDVMMRPDSFSFGHVKRGSSPDATVRVTFQGNGSIKILEVQAESNYIQPTFREVSRQPSEVVYDVTARMRSDAPVGRWFTDLWLKLDNPNLAKVRVPLTVEIESPLTVNPSAVSLGDVSKGGEVERKIIVRGIKPFKVLGVKGTDEVLSIQDSADASKPVHVLTLKFKAKEKGDFSRSLEIETDLDGTSSIEVQTSAHVVK